ncbi:MAG: glycosyltransferase [Thermodesulfobacteriota bacterium]
MRFALHVPTLNPGPATGSLLAALRVQTAQPHAFVVIDSSSTDDSPERFRESGAAVHVIERSAFRHGGTRQRSVELAPEAEVDLFLTQDAVPAHPEAFENLLQAFADPKVGAAFGRQLPRSGAGPLEAHARLFNYPPHSRVKQAADALALGMKTFFISNSFAAYRREALLAVGGFPPDVILSEDSYVSARLLLADWKVAYRADARVHHSHAYGPLEELRRYFDVGVFHAREPWIREAFGKAEGEGGRFLRSEWDYLWRRGRRHLPGALWRNGLKFAGYRLGLVEGVLPRRLKVRISMNRGYWQ